MELSDKNKGLFVLAAKDYFGKPNPTTKQVMVQALKTFLTADYAETAQKLGCTIPELEAWQSLDKRIDNGLDYLSKCRGQENVKKAVKLLNKLYREKCRIETRFSKVYTAEYLLSLNDLPY